MTKKIHYIISDQFEAEVSHKASRFIAYLIPVKNEEEIKIELSKLKTKHTKARHWCFAWRLGFQGIHFKSSDDGEPSGTAGKPILNQIDSAGLTNVVLVVVRYFGGTLLGTSGLIKAYKDAANTCISKAEIIPHVVTQKFIIQGSYPTIQALVSIIKEIRLEYNLTTIKDETSIQIELPVDEIENRFRTLKAKLEKSPINKLEDPMKFKNCIIHPML